MSDAPRTWRGHPGDSVDERIRAGIARLSRRRKGSNPPSALQRRLGFEVRSRPVSAGSSRVPGPPSHQCTGRRSGSLWVTHDQHDPSATAREWPGNHVLMFNFSNHAHLTGFGSGSSVGVTVRFKSRPGWNLLNTSVRSEALNAGRAQGGHVRFRSRRRGCDGSPSCVRALCGRESDAPCAEPVGGSELLDERAMRFASCCPRTQSKREVCS